MGPTEDSEAGCGGFEEGSDVSLPRVVAALSRPQDPKVQPTSEPRPVQDPTPPENDPPVAPPRHSPSSESATDSPEEPVIESVDAGLQTSNGQPEPLKYDDMTEIPLNPSTLALPQQASGEMEKLREYEGVVGRLHGVRDAAREAVARWREGRRRSSEHQPPPRQSDPPPPPHTAYPHVYRRKTRWELIRVSLAVMGIEFSYAAETAFVSPTLLQIGVDYSQMTLVWALSPLIGFFLTPLVGSISDRCSLGYGRRRPFILLHSLGVIIGLLLVPNGKTLGVMLGDYYPPLNSTEVSPPHPWGVFFTVLGTALLDFDADACQAPSRSYLLDVTLPEDHARGLSTFTIMAGLGGFLGYSMGGVDWTSTYIGDLLGSNVRSVFTLITFIFIACVILTVTAFKEVPLDVLETNTFSTKDLKMQIYSTEKHTEDKHISAENKNYGTVVSSENQESSFSNDGKTDAEGNGYINYGFDDKSLNAEKGVVNELSTPTLKEYLMSAIFMPRSMRILCLTNLFCWMAHVCYSLYFTDYVAESVFGGDPTSPEGSDGHKLYESGLRFGCWGMALYSLSCACYSTFIEKLIKKFKAKRVYIGGLLFYTVGMTLMTYLNSRVGVIAFSWTAGVMYSTLFTMPYLLVAHYHANNKFASTPEEGEERQPRGLGTDVAIVSSMVFLAQFILSLCMGSIIKTVGSTKAVVAIAASLAFCASICATQILYLDL